MTARELPELRDSLLMTCTPFENEHGVGVELDVLGTKSRMFFDAATAMMDKQIHDRLVKLGWTPPGKAAQRVSEGMVEALAKFIVRKEANNCKTLNEAMHHQAQWRRAIPEAREMLEAAVAQGVGG